MESTRPKAKIAAILTVAALAVGNISSAWAQSETIRLTSGESTVSRNITQAVERLEMLVKSSRILSLDERIPKFQVHNEEVVGATPVSQNQIQIFAKTPGTTQLNLWDTNDKLYTVDVTVLADAREVEGILQSQLPLASLKVMPVNDSAIIAGTVTSVDDVDRAVAIVEQYYTTVVNNIRVVGVQQVLLHTRLMEVSRTKLRDLGIDWGSFSGSGLFVSAPGRLLNAVNPEGTTTLLSSTAEGGLAATNQVVIGGDSFIGLITALRKQDLIKFLAEPTVVATHGRPARFNVGGKVPYLVPSGNGSISVEYEEYGTAVDFLPFVVGPGRIRLEVRPEVTEPDDTRSITASGIQVTAFSQRYVETAVEMQAGQTFAIAGLLQSRTESVTRATPVLGELPVIGVMFRRIREKRNDIELLITVTPELVDAMDPHQVPASGPGLSTMSPNDHELYLNGHIEVPNLLGTAAECSDIGAEGYSTTNYGSTDMPVGEVIDNSVTGLPPGAIIPTEQPVMVGEGVSISAPRQ